MRQLLNTLYVTRPRAYLHLDHDTVRVEVERVLQLQAPLLQLGSIVCFGDVMLSPALMHRCAEDGRSIVLLGRNGRFKARIEGPMSGNVLLRRAQHLALSDPNRRLEIARSMVAGKLRNSRSLLLRAARDAKSIDDQDVLAQAARLHLDILNRVAARDDLDMLRGDEGDAARVYFSAFTTMIRGDARGTFGIAERSRRPPRDPMNAVLSFLYTLLRAECTAALEGVGLDPQIGYLHALRPGRPALALDLMEEMRSVFADRLALTLVNRKELGEGDFEYFDGGAVYLNETGRRTVILSWQGRKEDEIEHRVLGGKTPLGLTPHLQARLLARHLRNDLPHYVPYVSR
ncbi:MAG: type I-C CRISPR-associated endonuclease Cas1 [Chloroflexia bacterium]|nr:type I-C CRISPR-associated endonuclease Cas1 [Chloroflexia bacterium]